MSSSLFDSKLFRIIYPHQTQPMCWSRSPCVGGRFIANPLCTFTLHESLKFSQRHPLLPHQQQRPNHPTNHPCQKSIRRKITINPSILPYATRLQHRPHCPWVTPPSLTPERGPSP